MEESSHDGIQNGGHRNRPPHLRGRHGRLRSRGRDRPLGQTARAQGHLGGQGSRRPLGRRGHGLVGHQSVRRPERRQEHAARLRRLCAQRSHGHHPRGSGGQHRPPRGLDRAHVREVGLAHLERRTGRLRARGALAGHDQRRVVQGHRRGSGEEGPGGNRRSVLRARVSHPPPDGGRQMRRCHRFQRP